MSLSSSTAAANINSTDPSDPADVRDDRDLDGLPDDGGPVGGTGTHSAGLPMSGHFLYDRSHGGFISLGDFANYLVSQGWTYTERTEGELSSAVLADVDILFLMGGTTPFTPEELAAVSGFLENGGGLWMVHDYLGYAGVVNQVSEPLGITFHNDSIFGWPLVTEILPHPVSDGVTEYTFYAGSCLEVRPPGWLLARLSSGSTLYCPETPGVMAIWDEGAGRGVFQSDATPLYSSYFPENLSEEHLRLLDNILIWLLGTGPIATESATWGGIKASYRSPSATLGGRP